MKNKNKIISLVLSVSLILSVFSICLPPLVSQAADETIYINTAEDLIDLAKKCSYDAWSIGKTVILNEDISLLGIDFAPIPSFSGIFDGNHHTISGLKILGAYSPAGLISSLEEGGVVKNLNLSATVTPDGDKGCVGGIVGDNSGRIEDCKFVGTVMGKTNVGGIVGINRPTGTVSGCAAAGEIIGENQTGGIAGRNEGVISSSANEAKVNTIAITPSLSLTDLNLSLSFDVTKLPSFTNTAMTDAGGIAGYSCGMIIGCVNSARVGYPHVGYNLGGIVGRSNGHLNGNVNSGEIFGRKDVGGIVGQAEPHISYDLSEDLLGALKTELDAMSEVIKGATDNTGSSIPTVSTRLDNILTNIDYATDALNSLMNDGADLGNGFIGEINRTSEVLDEVISQLSVIMNDVPALTALLEGSIRSLSDALADMEKIGEIGGEAIGDIKEASEDISLAFGKISDSISCLENGLGQLEEAIKIEDKDAAVLSLEKIADGLSALVSATDEFTGSVKRISDVLADAKWVDKGLDEIDTLVEIFSKVSASVSKIYDATTEIKENIDVNWSKMTEAGDELSNTISLLADTTRHLAEALTLMESGIDNLSAGLTLVGESISIKDEAALDDALKKIGEGAEELTSGFGKMSEAMNELSDIMSKIDGSDSLADIFGNMSGALGDLADAGSDVSDAMIKLGDGITTLLENVEINPDKLEEGGALIIAGMEDISDALGKMKDTATSLSLAMEALDKAVSAIKSAIIIKDENKLSAALDAAYEAIGEIIDYMSELALLMSDMTETLREAKLWGDGLIDAVGQAAEVLTKMSDALVTIQGGVDELRQNVSFDLDKASDGLAAIRRGLKDMAEAGSHLENAFAHISDAMAGLEEMGVYLPDAIAKLRTSLDGLADAMNLLTTMSDRIALLVGYLDGVDPIVLPTISNSTMETANRLFIYISTIETELRALNGEITSLSSDLVARVGRLNEIFNNISDNIVNSIYDLENGDILDDTVTEENIDRVTMGKIFGCQNLGAVNGDYNVGGIAGAMGIEYTIDPEDDLDNETSLTQRKKYKLEVVIHACQNNGNVGSKYDYAGGVTGKMDMGLIYGSETYCDVTSLNGNYVGGIAGITGGLISQCYAKSSLSGGKYVGGIVGSGSSDTLTDESSTVRNCFSMVIINRFSQYGGAVSGVNIGEFSENLFVSDSLAGIDRVSYAGKAEPISYEDLIKRKSIPTGFYAFTLEFVADGEIIYSVSFEYGASFDDSVFPEMPVKEGHYGKWDITDLTNLTFDTTVSVVYKPYLTTINSDEVRENGKNIFFVIGEFTEDDHIEIKRGCDTASLVLNGNGITEDRLKESWTLTIPKDSLDTNNIHFLAESSNCKIFVKVDGVWQEAEVKAFGSYLTFNVSAETVEIAVVESSLKISIEIIILIAVVLVQAIVIICILVKRKKKKEKGEDKKKVEDEEVDNTKND